MTKAIIKTILPCLFNTLKEEKRRRISKGRYENIELKRDTKDYYSTAAFDYFKCIFVHIPKSAGVSISTTLFGNLGGGHRTILDYQKLFPPRTFKRYFKFTFIRNPYTRLESAYNFLKQGGMNEYDLDWSKKYLADVESFEDFVLNHLDDSLMYSWHHFIPQAYYLQDECKEIPLDFIGRFENINQDFNYVSRKILGFEKELPRKNQTIGTHKNDSPCMSKAVKEKIYKLYKEDFDLLGYSK